MDQIGLFYRHDMTHKASLFSLAINTGTLSSVGDVVSSMLTECEFQTERDTTWVLMDGRCVAGSDYACVTTSCTIPDARGIFLRGKNNSRNDGNENPDGDSALGTYQADTVESHQHTISTQRVTNPNPGGSGSFDTGGGGSVDVTGAAYGGNETRSKNITINYFIKINR